VARRWLSGFLLAAVVVVVAVVAVCGYGSKRDGNTVSGKVLLDGEPVTSGYVTFVDSQGKIAHSAIAADGSYRIARVAIGVARIGVGQPRANPFSTARDAPAGAGNDKRLAPAPAPTSVIPERFNKPEASGLTYEVIEGNKSYDIELTAKPRK
jgi:hypothetical protein